MIKTPDHLKPRNAHIQENYDHENEVAAASAINAKKRQKKIDELIALGEGEEPESSKKEAESKDEAKELADFIEVIIKIAKPS